MGKKAAEQPAAEAAPPPPAAEATKSVDEAALEAANKVLAEEAPAAEPDAEAPKAGDDADAPVDAAAAEPDAKTAVFLRQKKLEQKHRERLAREQQAYEQKFRELEQKENEWASRARALEERETKWNRVLNEGDYVAAAELMSGRDPRKIWDTMAKASDPNVQRDVQLTQRERELMARVERVEKYAAQQEAVAQRAQEQQLEQQALEHMFDEETCPTICAHLNAKHPALRDVALGLYKTAAKTYVEENGVFDLRGIAIKVERDLRSAYAAEHKGSTAARTPSGADTAKGKEKPISSLSMAKLAGRESMPKSIDEMSEEERTIIAVEAANKMLRTA